MFRITPPAHLSRGLLDKRYTRRQFLTYVAVVENQPRGSVDYFAARDAVDAAAQEHPDWDMNEELTWAEWLAQDDEDRPATEDGDEA